MTDDDSDATAGRSIDERTAVSTDAMPTEPRVVLPDGGEAEAESDDADEDETGDNESGDDENDEESEDSGESGEDESDGEENDEENGDAPEKSAQSDRDAGGDGTGLVYLDLEGLFVDLLGVEIDLNEIELDVSAVPGSGNLLGNLLSQVAGLLDDGLSGILDELIPEGGLSGMLDEVLPEDGLSGLLPEIDLSELLSDADLPSASDVLFGAINAVLDVLLEALGDEDGNNDDESEAGG